MDSDATTGVDTPEVPAQSNPSEPPQPPQPTIQPQPMYPSHPNVPAAPLRIGTSSSQPSTPQSLTSYRLATRSDSSPPPPPREIRETFRDVAVKVHIRKPDKDSWVYLGRGIVSSEIVGRSNRIGVSPSLFVFKFQLIMPFPLSCAVCLLTEDIDSLWGGMCPLSQRRVTCPLTFRRFALGCGHSS